MDFTLSYATTDIQKSSQDTLHVARDVQKELEVYQKAAIEVIEKNTKVVQKSSDLNEEMRDLMEKFLQTVQVTVTSKSNLIERPHTKDNDAAPEVPSLNQGVHQPVQIHDEKPTKSEPKTESTVHEAHNNPPTAQIATYSKEPGSGTGDNKQDQDTNLPSEDLNTRPSVHGDQVTTNQPKGDVMGSNETQSGKESSQESALSALSDRRNPEVLPMVEAAVGPDGDQELSNAFKTAAENGNIEMMDTLLEIGASIDDFDKLKGTALVVAARMARLKAIEFLLERGANPNLGKGQLTPHQAILIEYGVHTH